MRFHWLCGGAVCALLAIGCGSPALTPPNVVGSKAQQKPSELSPEQRLARGKDRLAKSQYADAEADFRAALSGKTASDATLGLAEVLFITGRYAEAVKVLEPLQNGPARNSALTLSARAFYRQGAIDEAEAQARKLQNDPKAFEARVVLGELLLAKGKRADAEVELMKVIEAYNDDQIPDSDGVGLSLVGRAAHLLRSPRDANDAFNAAERAAPGNVQTLLWRAELFLEKYDPGHAEEVLTEVLNQAPNHPEAVVRMGQVRLAQALDFDEAERLSRKAMSVNPKLGTAYFVLGGIALRDMELELAEKRIAEGLAHNPRDLDLLSLRATTRFLADDKPGFEAAKKAVLTLNPEYSRMYEVLSEYADWEHRYDEIVAFTREAVALDARDAKAYAELGLNLIRSGNDNEGVSNLSRAFSLDPFNVRVFNTLNLYEKVIAKDYVTVAHPLFKIRYHKAEKDVLERYVPALMQRAFDKMVEGYGFKPEIPVGVELYAERENFGIRTSGLPQTAIQGVCFGKTLASMSPMNESFNLGMTLWHELSHVFHIQLSKSHVPRWFTEGLAEYETIVARAEWVREHDPELFQMFRAGRLPQVGNMSRAFTRAEELSDVATAYYASSLILVMLVEEHGTKKMAEMLRLWGQGVRTPDVVTRALGQTPADLDRKFKAFLDKRLARYETQFVPLGRVGRLEALHEQIQKSPRDATLQTQYGIALRRAGKIGPARKALATAISLEPKSAQARFALAELDAADEKPEAAVKNLRLMLADKQDGYALQMLLSRLLAMQSDMAGTKAALLEAQRWDPTQAAPLYALADIAAKSSAPDEEIAALRKLVQLEQHEPRVYQRLLRLLNERKLYADAVAVGEAALNADLTGIGTHVLFAEALQGAGDKKRAEFELESAVLCPGPDEERAEAYARLAEFQLGAGQRAKARKSAAKAKELHADNPRVRELKL